MSRILVAALVVLAALAADAQDAPAGGESTLERIARTGEFRIGFVPDAPPLAYLDAEGRATGYSLELCRHIASAIRDEFGLDRIDIQYTPLVSMEERLSAVEQGDVDIECGATTVTLSRRERVDFTLMTFITGSAVLSRKDRPLNTLDDLARRRIAVLGGTTTEDVLKRANEVNGYNMRLVIVDSHDEGVERLNRGRVDGYASDRAMLIGQVFRDANTANEYTMTRSTLSFEPYALMIRRGDTEFRLAADRALAAVFRTARIRRLYQDWFGRYGEPLSPIVAAMYQFQAVGE